MNEEGLFMKYFVLSPTKDNIFGQASRKAMSTYADVIQSTHPKFAEGIRNWVYQEESHIMDVHNMEGKEEPL